MADSALDLINKGEVLKDELSKMNRKQRRKQMSEIRRIIKRNKKNLKKSK